MDPKAIAPAQPKGLGFPECMFRGWLLPARGPSSLSESVGLLYDFPQDCQPEPFLPGLY